MLLPLDQAEKERHAHIIEETVRPTSPGLGLTGSGALVSFYFDGENLLHLSKRFLNPLNKSTA